MDAVSADSSRDAQESTGAKHKGTTGDKQHNGADLLQQDYFHAV